MAGKSNKSKKKQKFDFTDEAIRPFYASVGAADAAFAAVREYVGESTKRLSSASDDVTTFVDDLQKTITDLAKSDPKELAEALKALVEEKVASLQKDAKEGQENVESLVAMGPITDASGVRLGELPHVLVRQGPDQRAITLHWTRPVKGSLHVRLRMDNQD